MAASVEQQRDLEEVGGEVQKRMVSRFPDLAQLLALLDGMKCCVEDFVLALQMYGWPEREILRKIPAWTLSSRFVLLRPCWDFPTLRKCPWLVPLLAHISAFSLCLSCHHG